MWRTRVRADSGLICMLEETGEKKQGVGITGLGPSQAGHWGSKPMTSPTLCTYRLIRAHTKQNKKIWIHQNLLGHGCRNSPQTAWFLHDFQITLPRFVTVALVPVEPDKKLTLEIVHKLTPIELQKVNSLHYVINWG